MGRTRTGLLALLAAPLLVAQPASMQCEVLKLEDPPGALGNRFGYDVSIAGDVLVIGAPFKDTGGLPDAGSVFVFERQAGAWSLVRELVPDDPARDRQFGVSVAAGDDTLLVGAWRDSEQGFQSGAVYVFERGPVGWIQAQKLLPPQATSGEGFGLDVALDGETAVIGAPHDRLAGSFSGAVHVFERLAGTWGHAARLVSPSAARHRWFGTAVGLEGGVLAVGEPGGGAVGLFSGTVHVFEGGGSTWSHTAELVPSLSSPLDHFGERLDVAAGRIAAGAAEADTVCPTVPFCDSGAVFVFEPDVSGWSETAALTAPDGEFRDRFGASIALTGDRLLVGAEREGGFLGFGAVYLFVESGSSWSSEAKLTSSDLENGDHLGFALDADGDEVAIGMPDDDEACGETLQEFCNSGSAWIFRLNAGLSLAGCPGQLSLASGGTHTFELDAGPAHSGDTYFLVGSLAGSEPGFPVGGFVLPLVLDAYFFHTLANPNNGLPLSGSFGALDGSGRGTATFNVPPGAAPSLAGMAATHAFVTLSPVGVVTFVSEADVVGLLP